MFLSGFNYNEKCAFFSLAKNIAEADENISKNEDNLLRQYLGEMSLSIEQITDITEEDAITTFLSLFMTFKKGSQTACQGKSCRRRRGYKPEDIGI